MRSYFVKADQIDLPTDVDPLWADAEDANVFEASLCIHNASCHGSWQRWWHSDGYDVQRLNDDGFCWHLVQTKRKDKFRIHCHKIFFPPIEHNTLHWGVKVTKPINLSLKT